MQRLALMQGSLVILLFVRLWESYESWHIAYVLFDAVDTSRLL